MGKRNKPETLVLRQMAEKLLKNRAQGEMSQISEADALKLIQELEVHQIELELQNEELMLAKEQVAKAADEKYVELYDFAPSGYITISKEGKIIEINLYGSQMLGEERSNIIGRKFGCFVSDNTKPIFNQFLETAFVSKVKESGQVILSNNGKAPVYVHIDGIVMENDKYCLMTMVDITELKLAEQLIRLSQEKYKTLLNASPDGILLIDLNGIITEVSEIGLELFCASTRNDLVDKDFYRFVPSTEKKVLKKIIERTMNEGLVQNVELILKKRNQSLFFSEISSTLIQDPKGMPLSYMIIIRDISQRKKLESKQLHADRMASLGEMASGIAHEINQPLNTISLAMDNILHEAATCENIGKDYLYKKAEKIFENITRIRNIIDHVRAFSKSNDDYILASFNVNECIKNAISMISEQFDHLAIKLNIQLEKNLPLITGNTFKLEQVIINLLSNAKDAILEKKRKKPAVFDMLIGIRSFHERQSVIIEIADNGTGIKEEDIDHIMLPFYTTKDTGKGTGLGLSVSYQIIKEMNGTIDIVSKASYGTIFKVVLNIPNKEVA
jgi:PAS domain S-box-containing protein